MDTALFLISNLGIFFAYIFVAVFVTPLLPIRLFTRIAAIGFFTTCGLTHLEQVFHGLDKRTSPTPMFIDIMTEPHMLIIHVAQVVFVWCFALGFFRDLQILRESLRKFAADALSRLQEAQYQAEKRENSE